MVPVRRGTIVAIVLVTLVAALLTAVVWRATFPDIDDDRPPDASSSGGPDDTD